MRIYTFLSAAILLIVFSCDAQKKHADLILSNANVYTVDKEFSMAEAIAIRDHRIIAVGNTKEILEDFSSADVRDLQGAYVYPGWIDAHCHFLGYGMNLSAVDVAGTSSVEEIIAMLKEHQKNNPGTWITGRGWDQNDWEVKEFPHKTILDEHFPDTPILLRRIDGHAGWANSAALKIAGINADSQVDGGTVMLTDGEPNGILIDNAIGLVGRMVPADTEEELAHALLQAQTNCFQVGLTSVQDAGLPKRAVELIDSLNKEGELKILARLQVGQADPHQPQSDSPGP